jgi:glycosyltransferase involved in cell wall biosynthesis
LTVLVSIIIPAFRAQGTIERAVRSALAQSWRDVEVIVVADDDADYRTLLAHNGVEDERLRLLATGSTGSGCHNARNVGLAAARGDLIAALDADDLFLSARIATLLPIAQSKGAATDNPRIISEQTGRELYRAFAAAPPAALGVAELLALSVPLFPLVAREYADPRLPGIEFGEDFVANLRLIDRIGKLPVIGDSLLEYHVVTGSLSHSDQSADRFEQSYSELIERLERGDQLGLSAASAAMAREALMKKRDFNRAFAAARSRNPQLDFQSFAAQQR